jgi:hypothetical protein
VPHTGSTETAVFRATATATHVPSPLTPPLSGALNAGEEAIFAARPRHA